MHSYKTICKEMSDEISILREAADRLEAIRDNIRMEAEFGTDFADAFGEHDPGYTEPRYREHQC